MLQIAGLFVWTWTWVAEGIINIRYYKNLHDYKPFRNLVIIEIVGFVANLFNFTIVAYVIYKSSKVVS